MKPLLSIQMWMSRKLTALVLMLYSKVNFIVGWKLLQCSMNSISSSSDPFQMKKMSSIYLSHTRGLCVANERISSSRRPMKRQAPEGAMRVELWISLLSRVRQNGDHHDRWSRKVWIFDRKFYLSFTCLCLLFDGKTVSVTKNILLLTIWWLLVWFLW